MKAEDYFKKEYHAAHIQEVAESKDYFSLFALMEEYANRKVKDSLNSVQSFSQGADEDMVYEYIEKLKNELR